MANGKDLLGLHLLHFQSLRDYGMFGQFFCPLKAHFRCQVQRVCVCVCVCVCVKVCVCVCVKKILNRSDLMRRIEWSVCSVLCPGGIQVLQSPCSVSKFRHMNQRGLVWHTHTHFCYTLSHHPVFLSQTHTHILVYTPGCLRATWTPGPGVCESNCKYQWQLPLHLLLKTISLFSFPFFLPYLLSL